MIKLEMIKELSFSAASGLVGFNNYFYCVSDDELSLEIFTLNSQEVSTFHPLLSGELPRDAKSRKKLKPDFEALLLLNNFEKFPASALLAIPSGSTSQRNRAVCVPISEDGTLVSTSSIIDFSPLYATLSNSFAELNIEGAAVVHNQLKLFQRGNGPSGQNAVIDLDLDCALLEMRSQQTLSENCLKNISPIQLPTIEGWVSGFTDVHFSSGHDRDRLWFLAAAERIASTYDDGPFAGSALGSMNLQNELVSFTQLPLTQKPEGLWQNPKVEDEFFIVTDADSRQLRSQFLKLTLGKDFTNV